MKILYHHRTRAADAQGVHIREMVHAFTELSHQTELASLVDTHIDEKTAHRSTEPTWRKLLRRLPFVYEAIQLGYNVVGIPWLLWKIRRSRVDFIYERYSLFTFAGVVAAKLMRRPIALEVNSPIALEQNRDNQLRATRFALWLETAICNAATRVIVVSAPLRRILIDMGVSPSKVVIMHNGANLRHFEMTDEQTSLRRSLNLEGKVVIGFAGWFKKWHGLEFLIEAFHLSGLAKRNAVLLLLGDGPAMAELQTMAQEFGIADAVRFTGPVPHQQIPEYLSLLDIAVQPAANEYCCPMKILEYMAVRKPVLAPKQENIQELLEDEKDALLFTPGDSADFQRQLSRLVDEPHTRARLAEAAYDSIFERGLTWRDNAARVVTLLMGSGADQVRCIASESVNPQPLRHSRSPESAPETPHARLDHK